MLFNKKNEVEFFSHELKSPQIALWLFIPNMWKPWQKLNCSLTFSRFYWIRQIWLVAGANSDVIDIVTKDAPARRIAGQGAEALGEHELVPRSPRSCCKENNQGLIIPNQPREDKTGEWIPHAGLTSRLQPRSQGPSSYRPPSGLILLNHF